jgi:pimeloyl-ACP methyl ester carboxylesterase
MCTKTINGFEIAYDESGYAAGPPIVLLTGWAHDMGLYDEMLPLLVRRHRVIRMCWRGHGPNRNDIPDFGVKEQVSDLIGLLSALSIDQFYLVSHSHGGWPALELADGLGKSRVLCLLMIDQIMTPPPPAFAAGLQAMQHKDSWVRARQELFEHWLAGSSNQAVQNHFYYNMGRFGHSMWSLSCRVIADAYKTHGSPMDRMSKIRDPQPIRHIFSHPRQSPEYRILHVDFASRHAFFSYADLEGETHFPDLEIPAKVVDQIEDLVGSIGDGVVRVNGAS